MTDTICIRWGISPEGFLDVGEHDFEHYRLQIEPTEVVAILDAAIYDADPSVEEAIHARVRAMLDAAQFDRPMPYMLSPTRIISRSTEDGRESTAVNVGVSFELTLSLGSPDIKTADIDTRRDREAKNPRLVELLARHAGDKVLSSMLASRRAAAGDPDNEFVHLYEIRDALHERFGSKAQATRQLGITSKTWDRLGDLANAHPFAQGRHRGEAHGQLRHATKEELEEARAIAKEMIENYAEHLEREVNRPRISGGSNF